MAHSTVLHGGQKQSARRKQACRDKKKSTLNSEAAEQGITVTTLLFRKQSETKHELLRIQAVAAQEAAERRRERDAWNARWRR